MLVLIVLSNQLLMQLSSNSLFKLMCKFFSFPTATNKRIKMLSPVTSHIFENVTLGFETAHDTAICLSCLSIPELVII